MYLGRVIGKRTIERGLIIFCLMNFNHFSQLREVISEKHEVLASLQGFQDSLAAIQAENNSLKSSLRVSSGMPANKMGDVHTWEGRRNRIY